MYLWYKDALREQTSLYHYLSLTPALSSCLVQISSVPPNSSCLSLSQPTAKCSHLNIGETHRSQLLNAISSLVSRTFHSPGSGKEEKHRQGRHKSSSVILWAEALFPLRVTPSSISLFSFPLVSLCFLIFVACYETPPSPSRSFLSSHRNFYLQPGTCFLHHGSHDWESLLLSVSLEFPLLHQWTLIFGLRCTETQFSPHWTHWNFFILKKPILPVTNGN